MKKLLSIGFLFSIQGICKTDNKEIHELVVKVRCVRMLSDMKDTNLLKAFKNEKENTDYLQKLIDSCYKEWIQRIKKES